MTNLLTSTGNLAKFITPPLGLEPRTDFTIEPVSIEQGLYALVHPDGVRVRILDASLRLPEYAETESARYGRVVDPGQPDDVRVFVMLASHAGAITANLDAPVIVDRVTGVAQQMVHPGELADLQVPLKSILRQLQS